MPDQRHHRGAHPEDEELFAPRQHPALRRAFADLCWLLDRGYALKSALALTGDRQALTQRQRLALARCACSADQARRRAAHEIPPERLVGAELWIDGYNLLITLEAALSGGVILLGRDGCLRDMASLHGTYRRVSETPAAVRLVGEAAARWGVTKCRWLIDRPVGNSARVQSLLLESAAAVGWNWEAELVFSPDRVLIDATQFVATSDSVVLDRCASWFNAARHIIFATMPSSPILDLAESSG